MSYLAPIHRPTSVKHALKLKLFSPDEECLVLAKANRLEIYSLKDEFLVSAHTRSINGKISILEKVRPVSSTTEHLFIGTDRHVYFTISWDSQRNQLRTEKTHVDLADKHARNSLTQNRCLIDPSNQFMALFLYDGIVHVIPLSSKGKRKGINGTIDDLGDPISARISDLFVRSCAFLHLQPKDKVQAKLALLYEDSHQRVHLKVRALDYTAGGSGDPGSVDFEKVLAVHQDVELGASHLIPVPAPAYGVLILGETTISYFDDADDEPLIREMEKAIPFVAWTPIDDFHWLLADEFGGLYVLMLLLEDSHVNGWQLEHIGHTARASVLIYLDDHCAFVGSHHGDSQLIRILPGHPGSIELMQTISNIAPVLDFTVMDMGSRTGEGQTNEYSSGQARIVTGSGVFGDGSLRSVRSGVGLEEQGILGEMDHATDIFALSSRSESGFDDILIVSFVNETRVFCFSAGGEIEEQAEFKGLQLDESTLAAARIHENRLIQVTTSSARLIDLEKGMLLSEWSDKGGEQITAASASDAELMLSVGGLEVATFTFSGRITQQARSHFEEGQISCVHVSDVQPDFGFIGFWQGGQIAIVDSDSLYIHCKVKVSDDVTAIPRSMLLEHLHEFKYNQFPTLLVALANGEVVTFAANLRNSELTGRKATILGTQEARLKAIPKGDEGLCNVFATCEHPSLIYGSETRIIFSAVTAEKATSVCAFNSELYPGAVAIATPDDVRISLVDTERTTHVQTLHVGELVRRIAYSPSLRAFGIGTIQRRLTGTEETIKSRFKLADEVLFEELDTYLLGEDELVESVIRANISEDNDEPVERFLVGTTYSDESQIESTRGRILVFAVTKERTLKLITELPVKGACRALGCIDGKIVAALVKTVVIYALRSSHLTKLCTYRTSTAPIDLAIHVPTSQIAVADLMKSVSILTYTAPSPSNPSDTTHKLIETARHFQTAWATAIAHVGEDVWLESDAEGNLLVLFQDKNALSEDDKRRLKVASDIRLGEMVNRIRPITVNAPSTAAVVPKAFMATVEGGVYLFGLIGPAYLDLLISLQSALAPLVDSLGDIPFTTYRAFKSQVREAEEPERFVDGELVEGFLDLTVTKQEEIVKGLGSVAREKGGVRGICELVEGLRRLH